jgi:hypothetical protein
MKNIVNSTGTINFRKMASQYKSVQAYKRRHEQSISV